MSLKKWKKNGLTIAKEICGTKNNRLKCCDNNRNAISIYVGVNMQCGKN